MNIVNSIQPAGNNPPPRRLYNRPKGSVLPLDLNTPEGRYAARAYAYFIMSEDYGLFQQIIERVGKEG